MDLASDNSTFRLFLPDFKVYLALTCNFFLFMCYTYCLRFWTFPTKYVWILREKRSPINYLQQIQCSLFKSYFATEFTQTVRCVNTGPQRNQEWSVPVCSICAHSALGQWSLVNAWIQQCIESDGLKRRRLTQLCPSTLFQAILLWCTVC